MAFDWKTMRRYMDRDTVLRSMGLEQRSPAGDFFTGLGLFAVGVLVGAGLGLMFAPAAGGEMRHRVSERLRTKRGGGPDFQRDLGVDGGMPPLEGGETPGSGAH